MESKFERKNFVLQRASDRNWEEIISAKDIDELLSLIDKYRNAIIIQKNRYLEEYDRDNKRFEERFKPSFVEKVKRWKRKKAYYIITIYDDYIEHF